jgi:hypothetical protein
MKASLLIRSCITTTLLVSTPLQVIGKERPLKHKALHTLDGMPGALDGHSIGLSVHVMKEIHVRLYGKKDGDERVGLFSFENKTYTIQQLAELEINAQNNPTNKSLAALLYEVKQDFVGVMKLFIEDARGSKRLIYELTEEWAHLHNRHTSFLLTWGKQKDGQELDYFFAEIDSFEKLSNFCADLLSFLDDLISSCPSGMKHYQELKEKTKKRSVR